MTLSDVAMKIAIEIKYNTKSRELGITIDNRLPLLLADGRYQINVYWNPSLVIGDNEDPAKHKTTLRLSYDEKNCLSVDFNSVPLTDIELPAAEKMNKTILKYLQEIMQPILVKASEKLC